MRFFTPHIINPYIVKKGYKRICEVGSAFGQNVDLLLQIENINVDIIDPCFSTDLVAKFQDNSRVNVHKGISLDILPKLTEAYDCILLDGDHNWYTVFNELKTIHEKKLLKSGGAIFLDDVGGPYGRRDMYYNLNTIPAEFIKTNSKSRADTYIALAGGGARNGVLTGVEDFLKTYGADYRFFCNMSDSGLGVLIRRDGSTPTDFYKWYLKSQVFHFKNLIRKSLKLWLKTA